MKNAKKKIINYLVKATACFIILILISIIYVATITNKKKTIINKKTEIVKTEEKLKIVDENSSERPIAVMIDNNIGEYLHAGLQESYLNYEIIVEGGLTRIMAIYKDEDVALIGPVRSSRHYFLDFSLESDAVYAHFGWSPFAKNDIYSLKIDNINGLTESSPFWRDSNYRAPHNVFTSTNNLKAFTKEKKYALESDTWQLLKYTTKPQYLNKINPEGAILANKITLNYSEYQIRNYIYDNTNNVYLREMNGRKHLDKLTEKQLNYKNIIIEKINNYTIDNEGRQGLENLGEGEGFYISNGYALPIYWTKTSRHDKTKYTYKDGTEIKVNDGNTFIQIVPVESEIIIE